LKIQDWAAGIALLAIMGAPVYGESGEEIYKAKCQMCHGASGLADSGAGRAMKVKPVTDPEVRNQSEAQMFAAVQNGSGRMQPYRGKLTDAQIRDAVSCFRRFIK
jgi:cytochrome c6